ncbi:MAG: SBBP repeat-containing protein [Acidobacteriota bacterium]|nr:SBBP repeat-containing protein [Acidobacteriota bacterium]
MVAFEARDRQYVSRGSGYSFSVNSHGAVLNVNGRAVRMAVIGASPKASLLALDRMPGKANYLLGRDVRASYDLYGRVRWREVYSGIDIVFRGNQEHLEYDFEVGAGRDPGRIVLAFDGLDDIRIDRNGDLEMRAGEVRIRQPKPVSWQTIAGLKRTVDVEYRMDASKHVRLVTGAYDRRRALVIDPQIIFEKFFGGSGMSTAVGLARDTQGNLYVAGTTDSTDFATVNPFQSRLGTAPLLVTADAGKTWSFPSLGPARQVNAMVAAPSTPLIVYAATPLGVFKSSDGGTSWAANANAGLTSAASALAVGASSASTVYAGTAKGVFVSTDGAASWRAATTGIPIANVLAIAAHPSQAGTVFASIQNTSAIFRSTDFGQTWIQLTIGTSRDVNAIVFGSNGALIAATFNGLFISTDGGNTWTPGATAGVQANQALAISPGNPSTLYLVNSSGVQKSTDGGKTLNVVLSGINSSFFGGVAVDPRNPATVYAADINVLYRSTDAGQNWSQLALPYPVRQMSLFISPVDSRVFLGVFTKNNVFVTKWSPDGSQVLYSTYLGGNGDDEATGIAVDGTGSAYITGFTSSPDFPTTPGAFQAKLFVPQDIFAAKLSPDGSKLIYSTLFGSDSARSSGIAVDGTGDAVITGLTRGSFPITASAFQSVSRCTQSAFRKGDAFVTRISADGKYLSYSTLLGGSCPGPDIPLVSPSTYSTSVAVDASGNAWVGGATLTPDFPVTSDALQSSFGGGLYDGFLARFSPSGHLDYATYVGGLGYDIVNAIAFDQSGNIFLTGESGGLSQPASPGAFQPQASASCPVFFIGPSFPTPQGNALVLKLDPAAHSIQRLTYLGAPLCLLPSSIAVDGSGEPWIAGKLDPNGGAPQTMSPFEIGIGQGFISKFSADFTQLLFSTHFDSPAGLALDSSGLAYVAGTTVANTVTGTQQSYIAQIDPAPPAISLDSIVSTLQPAKASNFPGIAAGELIHILGSKMGPVAVTPGMINSGVLANMVAGVQVTFDGVAVPLLSVSAQEIDLIAPFALATKSSTTVQVVYNGVKSNTVQVAVIGIAVQILGVFNQDFSVNAMSNPAQAGSTMSLYVSGIGGTNPASQDGQINTAPFAAPGVPVGIEFFGNDPNNPHTILPVTFAGSAAGLVAGIFQINFIAPQKSVMNVDLLVGSTTRTLFDVWVK